MSTLQSVLGRGVLASRPAAGIPGQLYYVTDTTPGWTRDNGTSWDVCEPGGSYTLPDATTTTIGGVEVDVAPASGHAVVITAAGLTPGTVTGAPTTGTWIVGELHIDSAHVIWLCTVAGTPGTWVQAGGSGTTTTVQAESGGAAISGAAILHGGTNVTVTESGQTITIAATAGTTPAATTAALGSVQIDTAPATGNPIAVTLAGTALPAGMLGTTATTAAAGNDTRLSNARTPTAHETTHLSAGTDAIPWGTILGAGTDAGKPAAATSNAGYLWIATDTSKVYQSSGSAWGVVLTTSGGSYTLPAATTTALGGTEIDVAPASGNPFAVTLAGLTPAGSAGAPTTGTWQVGQPYIDSVYALYVCTVAGTPGTWQQVGGSGGGTGTRTSELIVDVPPPGTPYKTAVLADAPVAYYRFDESSGTVAADSSGNGKNARYNAVTFGQASLTSTETDTAVRVSSNAAAITIPAGSGLPTGSTNRTLELWVKVISGNLAGDICTYGSNTTSGAYFELAINGSGGVYFSNDGYVYPPVGNMFDGKRHQVVIVTDTSGEYFYLSVDGAYGAPHYASNGFNTPDTDFNIGYGGGVAVIDELSIYPKMLTAAEIANHWAAGVTAPVGSGVLIEELRYSGATVHSVDGAGNETLLGVLTAKGVATALSTKVTAYTLTATDSTIIVNAASLTMTLPSAVTAGAGRQYTIKNGPSGTSTTVASTAGTIDGAVTNTTTLSAALAVARCVSDGANWWLV